MSGPLVVCYGGGVNSTAMVVGLLERGERPDTIVFSDTGGEHPETYRFLDGFTVWLLERNLFLARIRRDGAHPTLEAECLAEGKLPALAFGMRFCSGDWKRKPFEKWATSWAPTREAWSGGKLATKCLGFDVNEKRRMIHHEGEKARWVHRYPLIEWGWDREACLEAIARAGLSAPRKSSCFFCPARRKAEVLELAREQPELFARAVALERGFVDHHPERRSVRGLGRSFSWEALAKADREQARFEFPDCSAEMPCDCYDGEPA